MSNQAQTADADRDRQVLINIARGPGAFATPSPDRVERLLQGGLVKKIRGTLRPTLKGRILAWVYGRN